MFPRRKLLSFRQIFSLAQLSLNLICSREKFEKVFWFLCKQIPEEALLQQKISDEIF